MAKSLRVSSTSNTSSVDAGNPRFSGRQRLIGLATGSNAGTGAGAGSGVGMNVGAGVGSGTAVGVGINDGAGVGSGTDVGVGTGTGVDVGSGTAVGKEPKVGTGLTFAYVKHASASDRVIRPVFLVKNASYSAAVGLPFSAIFVPVLR